MIHELRHYIPLPGKGPAMTDRFRVHVLPLFRKLNVKLVDFWQPLDEDGFWYVLEWPDEATAKATLGSITATEDWKRAKALTEADGPLIEKVESRFCRRPDWITPAYR